MLAENFNSDNLYNKKVPCSVKNFFGIREYRSRKYTVIEI